MIEPNISILLPCCNECRNEIASNQSRDPDWHIDKSDTVEHKIDWFEEMLGFYEVFQGLEHKIEDFVETVINVRFMGKWKMEHFP